MVNTINILMLGKSQSRKSTFINSIMQYAQTKGSLTETDPKKQIGGQNPDGPPIGSRDTSMQFGPRTYRVEHFPVIRHSFKPSLETIEEIDAPTRSGLPPTSANKLSRTYNLAPSTKWTGHNEVEDLPDIEVYQEFVEHQEGTVSLRIIDTPGIEDDLDVSSEDMLSKRVKSMLDIIREIQRTGGLNAIILTVGYSHMNGGNALKNIGSYCQMFGDYSDKIVVLFTSFTDTNAIEDETRERAHTRGRVELLCSLKGEGGKAISLPETLVVKYYDAQDPSLQPCLYQRHLNNVAISEIIPFCADKEPMRADRIDYIKLDDVSETDLQALTLLKRMPEDRKRLRTDQSREALDRETHSTAVLHQRIKDATRWLESHDTREEQCMHYVSNHYGPQSEEGHDYRLEVDCEHEITQVHLWSSKDCNHTILAGGVGARQVSARFWTMDLCECVFEFGVWTEKRILHHGRIRKTKQQLQQWKEDILEVSRLQRELVAGPEETKLEDEIFRVQSAIAYMQAKSLNPMELRDSSGAQAGLKLDLLVRNGYMRRGMASRVASIVTDLTDL
ncbi:hypothetical protein BDK51DRAFT_28437 [Blyttiomyces helicus]|uniref:Uncharacterized protein n=1 Tax=Blyttiomyces helicus TaxID=388810 RepID=A0A4P9WF12_9FUNG|nr:hypothetical protein BDK51DRAFT_28437 [Blyttiomyces helicus]|eukprot:RKO90992.1 hypothetical protein BDK51DRAFT_28437 [Blyttiomyces helicus]